MGRIIPVRGWLGSASIVIVGAIVTLLQPNRYATSIAFVGWLCLTLSVALLGFVVRKGILTRRSRESHVGIFDSIATESHVSMVIEMTTAILTGVVLIEVAVRKLGGWWGNETLSHIHLVFVIVSVISYVLAVRHNGERCREHRRYAYEFATFFSVTYVTGTVLVFQLLFGK